jgi:hypothetical protein
MFEKLAHAPVLVQENSAQRSEILGHTPSTTVLLNNQRRLAQQTGQQGSCWRRYRATWIRMVAMEEGL